MKRDIIYNSNRHTLLLEGYVQDKEYNPKIFKSRETILDDNIVQKFRKSLQNFEDPNYRLDFIYDSRFNCYVIAIINSSEKAKKINEDYLHFLKIDVEDYLAEQDLYFY